MTIASTINRNDYVGTGGTTVYAYAYYIFADTDLALYQESLAGIISKLTNGVDYTVQSAGNLSGGTITLTVALATGVKLSIVRERPETQPTNLRNQNPYYRQSVEDALDSITMMCQRLQDAVDRSLKLGQTEAGSDTKTRLPNAATRAGGYLGFDASGNVTILTGSTGGLLVTDGPNIVGQRNGANAQIFRVYNTYTDSSNWEAAEINWQAGANVCNIWTQKAGSGSARALQFGTSGTAALQIDTSQNVLLSSAIALGWGSAAFATPDVFLRRDAANAMAMRNGVNAQQFRVYNTYTDASNNELLQLMYSANIGVLQTNANGTGTFRNLQINAAGGTLTFQTAGSSRVNISASGLLFNTDNSLDIGASGATRPRSLYWGTQALGPDGAVGTPSYSFTSAPTTGFYINGGQVATSIAGTIRFSMGASNFDILNDVGTLRIGASSDAILARDAAQVLAVKNGTNAQTLRVYGTTTGPQYARLAHDGTNGQVDVVGGGNLLLAVGGVIKWGINVAGTLYAQTDSSYDFGASGANRVRNMYWGTQALGPDGAVGTPSYGIASDATTGLYKAAASKIAVTAGGAFVSVFSNSGYVGQGLRNNATFGWVPAVDPTAALDVVLQRDAAATLALVNGTTAQEYRIYGTTTGPKYLSLKHDGTNGVIGLFGAGVLSVTTDISPSTDTARNIGTSALRFQNIVGTNHLVYGVASDANPVTAMGTNGLSMGAGGAVTTDIVFGRSVTNAYGRLVATYNGTLTGSPADLAALEVGPTVNGAFTVTRFSYFKCTTLAGAATITDACMAWFDAAVGTHKALASPGAVAVTLGTGPTGSNAGNPLGWIKMNINGVIRFTPFW